MSTTDQRLARTRSVYVRRAWQRWLSVLTLGVAAAGAGAAAAACLGAPEVAVLAAVLALVLGAALSREARRPVAALAVSIESARSGTAAPDVPGAASGVGRDLVVQLGETLAAAGVAGAARDERLNALEALVRHAEVALIAYDSSGQIVEMNLAARQLLGSGYLVRLTNLPDDLVPLMSVLEGLSPGERHLVRGVRGGARYEIAVRGTSYVVAGHTITAAALVDVHRDLEDRESEAWASLTRVLTHEIANSVVPISSLSETAASRISKGDTVGAVAAVKTIGRRAAGLVRFVESYRAVARVPTPTRAPVRVGVLVREVCDLLLTSRSDIQHTVTVEPEDLVAFIDADLIEQALINLLRNAIQALAESITIGHFDARIDIQADVDHRGRFRLSVADNGPGIPPEALNHIFLPFYTTREDGSGIGLALCRQIARVHGGYVDVVSKSGRTSLTLVI